MYKMTDPTTKAIKSLQRKQQILQALAQMLEQNPGELIYDRWTGKTVGVFKATLYRHFPQ